MSTQCQLFPSELRAKEGFHLIWSWMSDDKFSSQYACNLCFSSLLLAILAISLSGCGAVISRKVTVSATSFDFGIVAFHTRARRITVTLSNTQTNSVALSPALSGNEDFSINQDVSCGKTLA